jgi:hypothetical protein
MKGESKLSGNSNVNNEIIHKPTLHFVILNDLQSNNYNKNSQHLYDFWNHPTVQQLHFIIYICTVIYKQMLCVLSPTSQFQDLY